MRFEAGGEISPDAGGAEQTMNEDDRRARPALLKVQADAVGFDKAAAGDEGIGGGRLRRGVQQSAKAAECPG